jgi:integrase
MSKITPRLLSSKPAKRIKQRDDRVRGLYVSISTKGVATFNLKFVSPVTGKQKSMMIGIYRPGVFTLENARAKAYRLRQEISDGFDVAARAQAREHFAIKRAKTLGEIIDERIEWLKTPERKADGEMRPRIESWKETASVLNRFVRPQLGRMIASEVTKHDIASLSNDIIDGKFGAPSVSNSRHVRKALSSLFRWAAQAGRDYVSTSPCVDLPPLPKEHPKDRHLSEDEIRIFWHGLDREDGPWDRRTRLALKFALVTMLRSGEFLPLHVDEIVDLDGDNPRVDIPLRRVKKRRVIQQPLSDLAVGLIREALSFSLRDENPQRFVFQTPRSDAPLNRMAMAAALRGRKDKGQVGICEWLGIDTFTPHDLRRSSATIAGNLGFDERRIAQCLDHQTSSVTAIYNRSDRLAQKREVLDAVAAEIRRIVGPRLVRLVA